MVFSLQVNLTVMIIMNGLVTECSNRSFKTFSLQVNLNVMIIMIGLVTECSNRSLNAFSLQVNLNVMIRLEWRASYLPVLVSYTAQTVSPRLQHGDCFKRVH